MPDSHTRIDPEKKIPVLFAIHICGMAKNRMDKIIFEIAV